MPRPGGGNMGHSKHRKKGHPGHNADMIQTNRFLNEQNKKQAELKRRQKEKTYPSVSELMKNRKK